MDTEPVRWNAWLRLLTNVGVVVGLVAILLELRHAAKVSEVEAYQARSSEIQLHNLELAMSDDFADILYKYRSEGKENLSPAELIRLRAWYMILLRQMQAQYYQYQKGFLETEVIESSLNGAASYYDTWIDLDMLRSIENSAWKEAVEARRKQATIANPGQM